MSSAGVSAATDAGSAEARRHLRRRSGSTSPVRGKTPPPGEISDAS